MVENVGNSELTSDTNGSVILTANELANVLGENYKSVAKLLNSYATEGKISVTEKLVNNRALKGYKVNISDIQSIKKRFTEKKHLSDEKNTPFLQMVQNAYAEAEAATNENKADELTNVKIYEVMKKNSELTEEIKQLKTDMQAKINENVRLDADLSVARSEMKLIEAKSSSMEAAFSEKKLLAEKLEKQLFSSRIINIVYTALALMLITAILTIQTMKNFIQ